MIYNSTLINQNNIPKNIEKDISKTIGPFINNILKINMHFGHKNTYYDVLNENNETISIKTNISSNLKICPQNIGQVSVQQFNKKTQYKIESIIQYKDLILNNTNELMKLYIDNLFCCQHLLIFNFIDGEIIYIKKNETVHLNNITYIFTKNNIDDWNESNTIRRLVETCKSWK